MIALNSIFYWRRVHSMGFRRIEWQWRSCKLVILDICHNLTQFDGVVEYQRQFFWSWYRIPHWFSWCFTLSRQISSFNLLTISAIEQSNLSFYKIPLETWKACFSHCYHDIKYCPVRVHLDEYGIKFWNQFFEWFLIKLFYDQRIEKERFLTNMNPLNIRHAALSVVCIEFQSEICCANAGTGSEFE